MSILPVLTALAQQAPDLTVLLTTGTVASAQLLESRLPGLGLSGRAIHRFAPLDVPAWVTRFLDRWRPDAACFVESELWPNQIRACRERGIKLALINARMSDRSFNSWRRAPSLAARLMSSFAIVRARGQEDADRLRALGAVCVEVPGDLKEAAPPLPVDDAELASLRSILGGRPVWLAASTHPGEEVEIAAIHRRLAATHPGLLTIVAPRHPDRGSALAAELGAPRRSAGEGPPACGVWIVDTLGEMGLWCRLARIVFVGRSLHPPGGGQNPLEPARLGCAVLVGPHTSNFIEHVTTLRNAGALIEVSDAESLTRSVADLLGNPIEVAEMGRRAATAGRRLDLLPSETASALIGCLPKGKYDGGRYAAGA